MAIFNSFLYVYQRVSFTTLRTSAGSSLNGGPGRKVPTYSELRQKQQENQPSLYAFSDALANRPQDMGRKGQQVGCMGTPDAPPTWRIPLQTRIAQGTYEPNGRVTKQLQ